MARTAAVFFDVDFTLIHPGPTVPGASATRPAARRTASTSTSRGSTAAVAGAASAARSSDDQLYDAGCSSRYTRRIIELMGGAGAGVDEVAQEIYDDWAEHQHFALYDDVPDALRALQATAGCGSA